MMTLLQIQPTPRSSADVDQRQVEALDASRKARGLLKQSTDVLRNGHAGTRLALFEASEGKFEIRAAQENKF